MGTIGSTRGSAFGLPAGEADPEVTSDDPETCGCCGVPPVDLEALTEPGWPERGPRPGGGAAWA